MNERRLNRLQHKWLSHDREQVDKALSSLLVTSEGRKYLWWLLEIGRVGQQPFTANALTMSFNCGELNVGQQVLDRIIQVDPAGYVRMMQEQADERRDRDNQLAAGSDASGRDDPASDLSDGRDPADG